jgi:hypothetical protein
MDITGLVAVTFIFGGGTLGLLAMSPVGRAIADRIRGDAAPRVGDRIRNLEDGYESMAEELDQIRGECADLQERLDFTERMLARDRKPELPAPPHVQD